MADDKIVFVAFAIEDEWARNMLKGQSLNTKTPFSYIDLSVKEAYEIDWKEKVRTRIRRSHGVLAFVSKNSLTSSGQKWELDCARAENKQIRGFWTTESDHTSLSGVYTVTWTWPNIAVFIDSL